jgi:hypothetical protein
MNKGQHTSIRDLAAVGQGLSEEHLRLAAGGMSKGGRTNGVAPTYEDFKIVDTCTD